MNFSFAIMPVTIGTQASPSIRDAGLVEDNRQIVMKKIQIRFQISIRDRPG